MIELDGLMDVGRFGSMNLEKYFTRVRIDYSKWVHTYSGDEFGTLFRLNLD